MKHNRFFLLVSSLMLHFFTWAQAPATYSSDVIYRQLKKLNVLGSVLYIAAHPDDENTRLLAYLSQGRLLKTGYLSLTRGDGGQNLIGDEQGIDLGLIRTQELLDARRIDGAEQFFSRAYDFGYCKTADEALQTWGHDKILSDVVWVIRKFRPDVIITRFPGDERAGHGHHAASAILANEAFTAAADPHKFPEQLNAGVTVWQAKRILWNTFNFGSINTTDPTQFKLDVGGYNSLIGKSYGEIAAESRSQHKTQGFGVPAQRGTQYEYFTTTGGTAPTTDLLNDIPIDWLQVPGGSAIEEKINQVIASYNFEHPENSIEGLLAVYTAINGLPDGYWKQKKLQELKDILLACSGLFAEVTASNELVVAGENMGLTFSIITRNPVPVKLLHISLQNFDTTINTSMALDKNYFFRHTMKVPAIPEMTQPYWLQKPLDHGSFDVTDQQLIGRAQNAAPFKATFVLDFFGQEISVNRPVQYKYTDPARGELYEPLAVIPALEIQMAPSVVFTNMMRNGKLIPLVDISLQMTSHINANHKSVRLQVWQGNHLAGTIDTILNLSKDRQYNFHIVPDIIVTGQSTDSLHATIAMAEDGQTLHYSQQLHSIRYDHIPDIHYLSTAYTRLIHDTIRVSNKKIGYIEGAGDKMVAALRQMGYAVNVLSENDLVPEKLRSFDAIITGVRAYNVLDWLPGKYDVLMQFVKNGGNLIVQYNTNNQLGGIPFQIGPYPFTISRIRVTDETAAVHFLQPQADVLNFPNKISAADFDNWIQERSIYQAEKTDSHYIPILGMHDANEPESTGSLVIAPYGSGNFVYTGLVFFREMPAGVPGAFKLMANLVALPKH